MTQLTILAEFMKWVLVLFAGGMAWISWKGKCR
jgi:hypothetical protein